MMFKIIFTTALALAGATAHAAKGELFTRDEILAEYFPGATVERREVSLTPDRLERLRARLGYVPRSRSGAIEVFVGRDGERVLGYAVIDDEKGMHEPITFSVLVSPDGAVVRQEVLAYRETEGDGITRKAFRRQFVGKTLKSAIRPGVDLTIVTGATISSNSMAIGVKRALAVVTDAFLDGREPPSQRADVPMGSVGTVSERPLPGK